MRTPHLLAGLTAIALLLCAAWFAFGDHESDAPPIADLVAMTEASFDPADVTVAEASASRDLDSEIGTTDEAMREEVAVDNSATASSQAATEGPVVTVMRIDDGKPVIAPQVEIAWIGVGEGAEKARSLPKRELPPRKSEQPFAFGRKSRTGADGTIQLPPLPEQTMIAARDGNLFAFATIDPGRPSTHMLLAVDETLTIRVLDDQDRGVAEAPLTIQRWIPKQGFEEKWSGFTNARGDCVIRHFQFVRAPETKGDRYAVAVTAPQKEPSWLEFQPRPAPTDPITLRLTDTRQLAVRIVHKSGAPILASLDVSLRIRRPESETTGWRGVLPDTFERLDQKKPRGSEPMLFAHAGYGSKLQPFLQIRGERAPRRLPEITLPDASAAPEGSNPFEVTLMLPDDVVVLAMRTVDAEGAPLSMADIPWQLRKQRSAGLSGNLETLEDGRADFLVPSRTHGSESKKAPEIPDGLPVVLMLRETLAPELVLGAETPIGALQAGERRDLGTIAMAPLPLLCEGRVLDDRGEPRANAPVFVALALDSDRGENWQEAPHLQKSTNADGTFAFYAPTPQQAFRVETRPDHEHFAAMTAPLSPGAHVELRTTRTGILQGRVIPPRDLPENALTLTLVRQPDGSEQKPQRRPSQTPIRRKNGWFWLGGLEAGTYTATVTMRGLAAPLASIDGVRIAPGPNEDARLSPLDLSQSLFRYELRAVGPSGQPLTAIEGPVLWRNRPPNGDPSFTAFRWQNGKATFFLPVPFAELVIVGPGIRSTEVAVTPNTRDVVVDPITPFLVELPGVRALAGPTRAIRVSAVFLGETGLPQGIGGQDQLQGEGFSFPRNQLGKSGGGWLDAADRTGLVVSQSGKYELTLRLYEGEARDGSQRAIPLGNWDVDVDGRSLRTLVLPVDLQQVQQALAQMQPQPNGQAAPQGQQRGQRRR